MLVFHEQFGQVQQLVQVVHLFFLAHDAVDLLQGLAEGGFLLLVQEVVGLLFQGFQTLGQEFQGVLDVLETDRLALLVLQQVGLVDLGQGTVGAHQVLPQFRLLVEVDALV